MTTKSEDSTNLSTRQKLDLIPLEKIEELRKNGEAETVKKIERNLKKEAESFLTEDIRLEGFTPPGSLIIPGVKGRDFLDDPQKAMLDMQNEFQISGGYREDLDGIIISGNFEQERETVDVLKNVLHDTDSESSADMEINMFTATVHEYIHNDTFKRLTGVDESIKPSPKLKMSRELSKSDTILRDLNENYGLSFHELYKVSRGLEDELDNVAQEYEEASEEDREELLADAYEMLDENGELLHLASSELEPHREAFAYFVEAYLSGLENPPEDEEITDKLNEVAGIYQNLTEHSDMDDDESVKYLLEEVQFRQLEHAGNQVKASYEQEK